MGYQNESNSNNVDHYLDDFRFAGKRNSNDCKLLIGTFDRFCNRLGIPVAQEKTEGPSTKIHYLGFLIETEKMIIQIPDEKVAQLKCKIKFVLGRTKVTLWDLQSLCGSLVFCSKVLPAGRGFSRRIYFATSNVKKSYHYIKVNEGMYHNLMVWNLFLDKFNGISYMLDVDWSSSSVLQLYCDSAAGATLGYGCYLQGIG